MLDKNSQAAPAANPVPPAKFKVADYVVWPRLGLSVISAHKAMDIAGLSIGALEVRPLHDLKTSVTIPDAKVSSSALRRPGAPEDFKEMLTLIAAKAKGEGQRWHSRAQKYEERLKTNDLFEIASVIRDIIGKHRDKKFKGIKDADVPADVIISYSERMLVKEAMGLLSREMSFVTGLPVSDANRLLVAAALDPDVKIAEMNFANKAEVSMPGKKFEEIFGRGVREASKANDNHVSVIVPTAPQELPRRTIPSVDMAQSAQPARTRVTVGSRARPSSATNFSTSNMDDVQPELRALYERYSPDCALFGYKGSAFKLAAQNCSAVEFELLCRFIFMKNDRKPTPEETAQKMGLSVDAAWKRAEEAYDRLKKRADVERPGLFTHVRFPARESTSAKTKADKPQSAASGNKHTNTIAIKTMTKPAFSETLKVDTREIYQTEISLIPQRGIGRSLFRKAAQILTTPQFAVLSATALRQGDKRVTIEKYAEDKKMPVEQALALRNAASTALRAANEAQYIHAALEDYKAPGEKAETGPRRQAFIDSLNADVRAVYLAEDSFVPSYGTGRNLFNAGAKSLTADQFDVLSKTALRSKEQRVTIEAYAEGKKISSEAALALRNQASKLLATSVDAQIKHAALKDYIAESKPLATFSLREEMKEVFAAEDKFSPAKGLSKAFFVRAADILNPQEFEILSKTALRLKENLMALGDVAAEKGLSREEVLAIRNAASAKLRAAFSESSPRVLGYGALNAYVEPVEKPARVEKPPVDMKIAGEIMDGKFRIILEMPLEALKGAGTFRVEGDVLTQADTPVSIRADGKVGRGRGGYFKASGSVKPPELKR